MLHDQYRYNISVDYKDMGSATRASQQCNAQVPPAAPTGATAAEPDPRGLQPRQSVRRHTRAERTLYVSCNKYIDSNDRKM